MKRKFNEEDLNREFEARKSSSEKDVNRVLRSWAKIMKMVKNNKELAIFLDYVVIFIKMLRDYISGKYRDVPVRTIAAIVGALVYLLCPADMIPDFIPGIGYIDDAGVLAACIRMVKYDLDKYQDFINSSGFQVA
ncbi:MAG: DUF1232 domain-containing protein [Spirochaetia bacterium]|nr:DUF1232 domain-containing protein [Ruminococcus sp.]MBR4376890.1 DUF1232 domain-containing protein [Spirochaetia bacterium]